jgi:hypothetical protein
MSTVLIGCGGALCVLFGVVIGYVLRDQEYKYEKHELDRARWKLM